MIVISKLLLIEGCIGGFLKLNREAVVDYFYVLSISISFSEALSCAYDAICHQRYSTYCN